MYTLYFAVVFVTLAWSLPGHWEPNDCPQQCTCLMEGILRRVYCDVQDKQQLKAIPSRFPADSQYISLKGNRISTIPASAFSNLRDLRYLDLASNELECLPPNIFQGLTTLESLNLSRNRLGQLPSDLLHGLNNLRDLYLDGNVLENLPKDFFEGLTSLRRLYLDSNNFYTLSDKLFGLRGMAMNEKSPAAIISNLTSLVELLLNHNGIGQVQHDSFNRMSDLRRLKLNDNNITTLPRGIFRDLRSLRLLSLYKNPFQCTCSLKWLKDWIVQNQRDVTVFYQHLIRCEGPARLRGKGLLDVKDSEFGCEDEWSEWSNWDSCSKACNHGRQNRSRQCKSGVCKGSDIESRRCNTHKCEPEWSPWSVWTPCSVTCSVGYQTRSHYTQCTQSPCQRVLESQVRVCPRRPCPSYTEWSSWSMCNPLCGQGKQVRQRECATSHFGVACPAPKVETQDCKIRDCAEWTKWGMWSACSKNCSKGERTRKRDCVIVHGSKQQYCPGNDTDKQECYIKACPVDGSWSSWYPWTSCSKTCGIGFNTRHRRCSNPYPQHGGAKCNGSSFEVTQCVRGLCNDTSVFTPWSEWSPCSIQCGRGFKSRRRSCKKQDPKTSAYMCLGKTEEDQNCEEKMCAGVWGEWTLWTKCKGGCNQGQTFRLRFCVGDHGSGGYVCAKNKTVDVQGKNCKPSTCSNEPVWSGWSAWSACSHSCATGTKRRLRYCVTKIIGKPCPGNQESKSPCNTEPCPIHGGWSIWSEWGKCNEACDGGMKQRNRTCTEPVPQHNGQQCIGDSKDKTICNKHRCRDYVQSDTLVSNTKTLEVKKPGEIRLGQKINCPTPEMPRNGKYTMNEQKDQHKFLEYKCDDYYRNRGLSTMRYCSDDGRWSGHDADCVPDCGEFKANRKGANEIKSIRNMIDFWPWQVAIEVPMKGIHCGGVLIGDQWVLTAAHCVLPRESLKYYEEIKVILGTHNLTDKSSREVQIILVNKTEHHKDFAWDDLKHGVKYASDIAILKLERKVHITKYVHPVCLPKRRRRKRLIRVGQMGVFAGWGGTQEPHLLRQIPLPVVRRQECQRSYKRYKYRVNEKMMCAGYNNTADGICKKDSGGGFFFFDNSKRRKRWVLGGIASWRFHRCNEEGKYSVFTDVTKHITWISEKMDDW